VAAPPKAKSRPKPAPEPDEDEADGEEKPKRRFDFRALGRKVLGAKLGGKLFGPGRPVPSEDEEEPEQEPEEQEADEDELDEDGKPKKKKKKSLAAFWHKLDKKKKIAVAGAGGFLVVLMIAGGAWWALKPKPKVEAARPRLEVGARLQSALAPPAAEEEAPGATKGKAAAKGGTGGGLNVLVSPQATGAMLAVPAVNQDAFARIPDRPSDPPLIPAPDIALVEQSSEGSLPKIGRDGRRPWQVYAGPGPAADDARPRIAIVIGRLGLSRPSGIESIRRLPGAVTLAFDTTAKGLPDWISRARQAGHEVLLTQPVRSTKFPIVDEGPAALQVALAPPENIKRLEQTLTRGAGYVGVITTPEGELAIQEPALRPVMEALHKRGLMIVDGGGAQNTLVPKTATALGQPAAVVDVMVDAEPSRAAIDAKLADLETMARSGKAAVGFAQAYPVTIERLVAWIPTLAGKGILLVPVSAVAGRQVR
jgi:polysaccharide deacetylase 2 family uncharacterized protein YibQ